MTDPYAAGQELAKLFGRFEHALKRSGFLQNKDIAMADWSKFAHEIGDEFYEHIKSSKEAETLLRDPPRKLMRDDLKWEPQKPEPLNDVVELFVQGVCRVRNSFVHGEKFVGGEGTWERDVKLVSEALFVLREARNRVPIIRDLLSKI
jgi:hypothetical protein